MSAPNSISLRLPDEEDVEMVRAILTYESLVRGCSAGQAFTDLIFEAIDVEHYPPEILDCLREIGKEGGSESFERILARQAGSTA